MMLTSLDRMGDAARCEELGIKSYLIKPVKQSDLFDAIVLALEGEKRGPTPAPTGDESIPRLRPLTILLAEDSLANQKLAKGLLCRWGHTLAIVNNGLEAVEAAKAGRYDLILMDVQMPELDGLGATMQIREWEASRSRHIPIIAMTAHAMKGDRERCLASGMDGYCPKPIRPRELYDAIAKVLPAAAMPIPAQDSTSRPGEEPGAAAADAAAEPVSRNGLVDWPAALASMQGDEELLLEVIEAHLSECPTLLTQLASALTHGDAALARRMAHTLKGNCRAFQMTEQPAPAVLEEAASRGDLTAASEMLFRVQEQMQRFNAELEARLRSHQRVSGRT
jgi:two-component system sensor histidine kinase/response regulator